MEWTEENRSKLQIQINKKYQERVWALNSFVHANEEWNRLILALGICSMRLDGRSIDRINTNPNGNFFVVNDPRYNTYSDSVVMIIPNETAEKILVLGL